MKQTVESAASVAKQAPIQAKAGRAGHIAPSIHTDPLTSITEP